MKRIIIIVNIILVIILIQGCASISEFYHVRINSKNSLKKDFIIKLIKNPKDYDSILHNSEFYHPELSKYLDVHINEITNILKFVSYDYHNFSSNDAFLFDINNKILSHNIAYFFDNENIIFNKNVISVDYELINSSWYIVSIQMGSYRIQLLE